MEELAGLQGLGQVPPEDEEQLAATLALYAQQEDSGEWTQPSEDPYSEASLSSEVQPALPEEQRGTRRLVMKRKVLRHRPDGRVEVSDESEYDPKVWRLREEMLQPRAEDSISEGQTASLSPDSISEGQTASLSPDSISEGQMESSSSSFPHEPAGDSAPFILRDLPSRSSRPSQCSTVPKSFMPPRLEPLGQPRAKTDCVAKYMEYKREWARLGIPGEAPREELRRAIREQMRCPPELPAKPQRPCAVPHSYTVPSEKPRAALRWEVRWHLANGLLPCRAARRPSKAHSC